MQLQLASTKTLGCVNSFPVKAVTETWQDDSLW